MVSLPCECSGVKHSDYNKAYYLLQRGSSMVSLLIEGVYGLGVKVYLYSHQEQKYTFSLV